MAGDVELINGIPENFRDNQDRKFKNSQREKLERFVNGQDVFIFQPTLLCMNLSVSIKHGLRTRDYGLRTMDYGLGIKHGLAV